MSMFDRSDVFTKLIVTSRLKASLWALWAAELYLRQIMREVNFWIHKYINRSLPYVVIENTFIE